MRLKKNRYVEINMSKLSIIIITIYMLTVFVYIGILNSLASQILILGVATISLLIGSVFLQGKVIISVHNLLWFLPMIAVIVSLLQSSWNTTVLAGPIIFILGIICLCFFYIDVFCYQISLRLIKLASIFYSFSVILAILFPNLYEIVFLQFLQPVYRNRILFLASKEGIYTGFTSQVSYTAGYIINGVGIILCNYIGKVKKMTIHQISFLSLLIIGLLLTQKRAPILSMVFALFVVYYQFSYSKSEKRSKLLKLLKVTTAALITLVFVSQFTSIFTQRFIQTLSDLSNGGDVTNNRKGLFHLAWTLFKSKPLFGVGWGNYKTAGIVTVHSELSAHNMYLQLLAETGIIGTILILIPFLYTYLRTLRNVKLLKQSVLRNSRWTSILLFSLFIQTYFLCVNLAENHLWDIRSVLIMYLLACGMAISYEVSKTDSEAIPRKGVD